MSTPSKYPTLSRILAEELGSEYRVTILDDQSVRVQADLAFSREDALKTLGGLQDQICEHILKRFLFPRSQDVPHWTIELTAWARKLKRRNRSKSRRGNNYTRALLVRYFWEDPFVDNIEVWLSTLVQDGYKVPKAVNLEQLKRSVLEFIDQVLPEVTTKPPSRAKR
jgi:hypothetical protein